jgi:hypothetical protein
MRQDLTRWARTNEPVARNRADTLVSSQPKDSPAGVQIGQQRSGGSLMEYCAPLEGEHAVGQRQYQIQIMLHDYDGRMTA